MKVLSGLIAGAFAVAASPAAAASFVNNNMVTLDKADDFSWTVDYKATMGDDLPGTLGQVTFNFLSANDTGTSWKFSYTVDNTSIAPSSTSRLGAFGFNTDPNATSVAFTNADRFDAVRNGNGNFNGLGNREICFYAGSNCNGGGNNGVSVSEDPVKGTFELATLSSNKLVLSGFAARWQSTGMRGNGSNSGTGMIANTPVAAVPEPATWAMMLVGFGMVGAATRYRRKRITAAYA
jgi:hypothetical protein